MAFTRDELAALVEAIAELRQRGTLPIDAAMQLIPTLTYVQAIQNTAVQICRPNVQRVTLHVGTISSVQHMVGPDQAITPLKGFPVINTLPPFLLTLDQDGAWVQQGWWVNTAGVGGIITVLEQTWKPTGD